MTRVSAFSSPFMLGFDEIERVLDRVAKTSDGYPPYNIERIRSEQSTKGDVLRITLAVAGFSRQELDVAVEERQLVIRGRQQDDESREYLHRGIAARQFQRAFLLADGMEILGADLKDGLLNIDLVRPQPERIVRKIDIKIYDDDTQSENPAQSKHLETVEHLKSTHSKKNATKKDVANKIPANKETAS